MDESLNGSRILLTTDAVGGVWTYSLDLARELCGSGLEVHLAVIGPAPSEQMAEAARRIETLLIIPTELPLDWLAHRPEQIIEAGHLIARLAAENDCSIVQLHAPALAAAGAYTMPVISVHHSCLATWWRAVHPGKAMPSDFRWRSEQLAKGLAISDAVVAPTTAHAYAVAEAYELTSPPLVVRNGRCIAEPGETDDASRRAPFVLTSGRIWDAAKNVAMLDRAARLLGVPIYAAGSTVGPEGEEQSLPSLRLLGSLDQDAMRLWLSQAPIYASAAVYEPFGLGVLEAAMAGCALVLSDIPVFRELWAGACLFVPPDDEHAFADEVQRLLADPRLLQRLSERARRRARLFTPSSTAREMMRLYANHIALHRIGRGVAA
ncbi:glycosyltransferase family 4 protein [Aestuariivirga sp.]|uniref:glycosyltransferase family 4 protein n=1 Tax=Aestuariivirga sp. TaxID=2650926 RepID=UPI003BA94FBB